MEKNKPSNLIKIIYILISISLLWFILYPVINISIYGINKNTDMTTSINKIGKAFVLLKRSLILSLTVTILSTLIGFISAFTLKRLNFKFRKILKALILIPLINPPFVGSIAFIMLFGKRGLITHKLLGLTVSPFGFAGIVAMQVLGQVALAYILISSAIEKTNPTIEESARNMGASEWQIFRTITFRTMIPEITSASLLIFLSSISDFSTPIIIGGSYQTLASQLYIEITGLFDLKTAAIYGSFLLIPCLLAFVFQRFVVSKRFYFTDKINSEEIEYKSFNPMMKNTLIAITVMYISIVLIKYVFIIIGAFTIQWGQDYSFTLEHFATVFAKDLTPFINSIKLAVVTSFIASMVGVFLSYLISRKKLKSSMVVDFIATLPAAVPGILYGMGYLVSFNRPPLILIGTKIAIYIICISRFLNVSLRNGYSLLSHIDPSVELAAFNLGAGDIKTFKDITLPMLKPAFINSFIKNFTTGMVTLGSIILLMVPSNKVAVQMIFQSISGSSIGAAAAMALLLSFTSLLLVFIFYAIFSMRTIFGRRKER